MTEKRPLDYYILWGIAVVSLILNIVVVASLLTVRQQAGVAFAQAAATVGDLKDDSIVYNVSIDETLPVVMDVPVQFTVDVPIQEVIAIDTVVNVPIEIPLIGARTIRLPISTEIPIDLTIKVPIHKTIPINAEIPLALTVPIEIKIANSPLGQGLSEVEVLLLDLAQKSGVGSQAESKP